MENLYIDVANPFRTYNDGIKTLERVYDSARPLIIMGRAVPFLQGEFIGVMDTKEFDETSDLMVITLDEYDQRVEEILRQVKYRWN